MIACFTCPSIKNKRRDSAELKNQISHRAKALRKLKEYLLAAAERKG